MTSIYLDGDMYVVESGGLERFTSGKTGDWTAGVPNDTLLRPAPKVTLVAGSGERYKGRVYTFDPASRRILAYDKGKGTFVEQYRLAGGSDAWKDLRAMYVIGGVEDQPSTLVWLSADGVHQAVLTPTETPAAPGASGSPGPSGSAGPSSSAAPSGASAAPSAP
jgi:hypothetical protein